MPFDGLEKLIAAIGAALAGLLTPLGVIYAANMNRQTKSAETTVEKLNSEVSRLEARAEKAEEDYASERASGLKWYQVAMFWFDTAHTMRRYALDARYEAERRARLANEPLPSWPNTLDLPPLDPSSINSNPKQP